MRVLEKDDTMYHENEAPQILCDVERLNEINDIDQIMIASSHTNTPLCALHPYVLKRAGIVTTGNEVYYGRIQDTKLSSQPEV